jgi:hypothetical protein
MGDSAPLDAFQLEQQTFELVRRGFDPGAVRERLKQAAAQLRSLQAERDALLSRLSEMEGSSSVPLEAHRIAEALGIEATKVLESAHAAAAERADRAEREAGAVREAALEAAEAIRAEVDSEREAALAQAHEEAERIVEEGRVRGLELVAEARIVRERMLDDLARKRKSGRTQVEQLRAARDRLLEALSVAQGGVDAAVRDLVDSVPEARAAAERVGLRMESEEVPSAEILEGEIESARVVGHPLLEGIDEAVKAEAEASVSTEGLFTTGETAALTHLDAALQGGLSSGADAPFDQAADEQPAVPEPEPESEPETPAASADVDGLFARLREAVPENDGAANDASAAEPVPANGAEAPADSGPEQPVDEPEPVEDEPEPGPSEPFEAEQAAAEEALAKALKKVLVDEQSTLLDGIRQNGAKAVFAVASNAGEHAKPYEQAGSAALGDLAKALGGKVGQRKAGLSQVRTVALDPLRTRLVEIAETVDDKRELSDAVRALYREVRSQGIADAASAAVSAVFAEVVGAPAR